MEQSKNFLDELEEKFGELVESGIITREQLEDGIHIHKSWLYSSNVQRNDFINALMELLIRNKPGYLDNCEELHVNPDEPFDLTISQKPDGVKLCVTGNDQWSKLIVAKEKNPSNAVLQTTHEELLEEIFLRTKGRIQWDITKKLPEGINLLDIRKIFKDIIDPQTINALKDGQKNGLIEMADNLVDYYKYLLEQEEQQRKDEESKIIFGGYRDRAISPGTVDPTPIGGTSIPKKHDEIDFDKRDEMFRSLKPLLKPIVFHTSSKNSQTPIPSDYVYLYPSPNGSGYLIVDEPCSGNEITRTVYLSEEALQDFLLPGQEMNIDFWTKLVGIFVNMGETEFREETKHTCSLYHLDEESYLETLAKIITGQNEPKRPSNDAITRRVKRAREALFENKKITAKSIGHVADSASHEPDINVDILLAPALLSATPNKQENYVASKHNLSGPDEH